MLEKLKTHGFPVFRKKTPFAEEDRQALMVCIINYLCPQHGIVLKLFLSYFNLIYMV